LQLFSSGSGFFGYLSAINNQKKQGALLLFFFVLLLTSKRTKRKTKEKKVRATGKKIRPSFIVFFVIYLFDYKKTRLG